LWTLNHAVPFSCAAIKLMKFVKNRSDYLWKLAMFLLMWYMPLLTFNTCWHIILAKIFLSKHIEHYIKVVIDWLTDLLTGWLTNWLIDWLTVKQILYKPIRTCEMCALNATFYLKRFNIVNKTSCLLAACILHILTSLLYGISKRIFK